MQPITNLSEGTGYAGVYQHIYLIVEFSYPFGSFSLADRLKKRLFGYCLIMAHDDRDETHELLPTRATSSAPAVRCAYLSL